MLYKTFKKNIILLLRGFNLLLKIEKTFVFCIIFSNIISTLIPYVNILTLSFVINELLSTKNSKTLLTYVILCISSNIILTLLLGIIKQTQKNHEEQFFKNEKLLFSIKDMEIDYSELESQTTRLLRKKIDIESQTGYNTYFLYTFLGNVINSFSNIIYSLILSVNLFVISNIPFFIKIILLCLIVAVVLINVLCSKKVDKSMSQMFDGFSNYNILYNYYKDFTSQYKTGKEIRLYSLANIISKEQKDLDTEAYKAKLNTKKKTFKYHLLNTFISDLFSSSIYISISIICLITEIEIGNIIRYVSCLVLFVTYFGNLITQIQMLFFNNKYLTNYFSYLDNPTSLNFGTIKLADTDKHILEFKNVYFRYPSSNSYALENVSFTINPNDKIAIVGENGSGKTTIIKLLCRLYNPTKGKILLDGQDITKIDYQQYISLLSVTFQDFKLFSLGIGQNIATSETFNSTLVKESLNNAGFDTTIIETNGLETILYKDFDENGIEISGGEAQKIALARMLYKNTYFFILDEPTAALDTIAEYDIFNRINDITYGKSTLFISHRLYSCVFCNNIIVLDHGRIIQSGTHKDLLNDSVGKYSELWEAQSKNYN